MKKDKSKKLLLSMNLIDEQYIEEADIKKTKKPLPWRKFSSIAACIAVVLAGVGIGWLMYSAANPLAEYKDSEYYPIIQKLDAYYQKHGRLDQLGGSSSTIAATQSPAMSSPDNGINDSASTGTQSYEEITDNQVEGVIEADKIKRSDQYIYYFVQKNLYIYSIEGENSKRVGLYTLSDPNVQLFAKEFYLSEDCKTVTLIADGLDFDRKGSADFTRIISLDVSNPAQIVEISSVELNYSYRTSRKVDGTILLLGNYQLDHEVDYDDPATFIPQITTNDGTVSVPMDSIIVPEILSSPYYTVVCKLSEGDLDLGGCGAFLSYTNGIYVSKENVFAAKYYTKKVTAFKVTTATQMTEIACISYHGDSFKPMGTVSVAGWVKDQYCMDEYKGILRVVTTTRVSTAETYMIDGEEMVKHTPAKTSASLYCVDLSTWQIVAKVDNFAPEGETVRSARFEGDNAYVCTSKALVDPVFFFDLSDLNHITYTDTGTIPGFSTSLISFGDGYLIGIGKGNSNFSVKLEVYKETANGVKSVCTHLIQDVHYSMSYKSFLVDRKNQLIGFGINEGQYQNPGITNYYLFGYQDGKLITVSKTNLGMMYKANLEDIRAVYIDGYLYVCVYDRLYVVHVDLNSAIQ